jgi:arabinogalactan oligomer / maltooligosaccharide transport system substrate-binding protein
MKHQHKAAALLAGVALAATALPAAAQDPVSFQLWTKEGTGDGSFQFVQKLVDEYQQANPNVTITLVNKNVEDLRQQFLTTSLGGQAPELLWTVSDHVGPFTTSDTILSLDQIPGIDPSLYLQNALGSVQLNGMTWGVPISFGNHLMLYTNKDLIAECPADTDAWIAAAKAATGNGNYGMVWNQAESFWLMPFLGAFHAQLFDADGKATLNTPEMAATLAFLKDLKWNQGVMPAEADYNVADGMFKNGAPGAAPAADASLAPSQTPAPTGVAASIINGDWTLGAYADAFGDKLNICPIPQVTGQDWPAPLLAGVYFMFSKALANDTAKEAAVVDFVNFATAKAQQLDLVSTLKRLPGTNEAFNDPVVTGDPILAASAAAAAHGTGTPGQLEMRCVFDATRTGTKTIMTDQNADPAAVAAQMQADYDNDANCM